jgi:uncharacterized protein YjbI with pentapeptide repeats
MWLRIGWADTEMPVVELGPGAWKLKVSSDMDARGVNLRGSNFTGQDLSRARFDGCNLDGVRLVDCDLSRASFVGARLTGATIYDCKIAEADFEDAVIGGIEPAENNTFLNVEQLKSTWSYRNGDLRACHLALPIGDSPRLDFRGADLTGAWLKYGDFTNCDFSGATIRSIFIVSALLTAGQIESTLDYRNRYLFGVRFAGQIKGTLDLSGMTLRESHFSLGASDIRFANAKLHACGFSAVEDFGRIAETKNYRIGDLINSHFSRVNFQDADLSRCNLSGCRFSRCKFAGALFDDAVISGTDLGVGQGLTAEQIESTWNFKNRRMDSVKLP